ncbi:MAG: PaaX domain-containing protein, C- domain protein [Acidimicrobiia bacterium]|nr:PaaX domain-containing protein, C- domain protein [Acidimicrobiia bacterium]
MASTLLGTRPPRLPVQRLVQAGAMFGIAEGTVRTALSRMVAAGEVEAEDGWYRLVGRLLERQQRLDEGLAGARRDWDGTWELAVVVADRRPAAERAELRAAAQALHLAELREGVWGRPANLGPARLAPEQRTIDAQCLRFARALPSTGVDAARFWDLEAWSARARHLEPALAEVTAELEIGDADAMAGGFVLSAAVLRHLAADPLLPDELLPLGWPGPSLREHFADYWAAYQAVFYDWLRSA